MQSSVAIKVSKFLIPAQSKLDILHQLDALNINSRTMFPEIENVAHYIKQRWQIPKRPASDDAVDELI